MSFPVFSGKTPEDTGLPVSSGVFRTTAVVFLPGACEIELAVFSCRRHEKTAVGGSFLVPPTPVHGRLSCTRPTAVVNVARTLRCTRSCTRENVAHLVSGVVRTAVRFLSSPTPVQGRVARTRRRRGQYTSVHTVASTCKRVRGLYMTLKVFIKPHTRYLAQWYEK